MSPNLRRSPGAISPATTAFAVPFLGSAQRNAIAEIVRATLNRYAMVALTGPAGIGKTTVLREASGQLSAFGERITGIELPRSDRVQLRDVAAQALGRSAVHVMQPALDTLIRKVAAAPRDLGPQILVVDDVHRLLPETLEFLHRLATWPAADEPLWQVILSGRPEFWDTVRLENMREIGAGIAIRRSLDRLTDAEARAFVAYHLGRPESSLQEVIANGALLLLLELGQGLPGRLAELLDSACAISASRAQGVITREVVASAAAGGAIRPVLDQMRPERAESPATDRWLRTSVGGVSGVLVLAVGLAGWQLLAPAGGLRTPVARNEAPSSERLCASRPHQGLARRFSDRNRHIGYPATGERRLAAARRPGRGRCRRKAGRGWADI